MSTDPKSIPLGIEHSFEREVPFEYTIAHHHPELPPVLSTPAMIGLMEVAAAKAVAPHLAPGEITVGTRIEVDHLKASLPGARIRVWARLDSVEGRFLVFSVTAHEGEKQIGRGRVFRAIVDPSRHGR